MAANAISVNGGSAVTVTETGVTTGTVTIGATTAPIGAVAVSTTYTLGGTTGGAIAVTGGTTVSVTEVAGTNTTNANTL